MSYLDRLKETFADAPPVESKTCHQEVLQKLQKAPFYSFCSRVGLHISENSEQQPSATCPTCGSLQDVPQIPKSGEPRQVEAWTPSGTRLLVPAYSEEHAAAIQRMNPPPSGDKPGNFLSSAESKETGMKFDAADRQEAYEERCAIMRYDGGLTMKEAEQKAGTCYYCRRWHGTRSGKGYCVPNGLTPPIPRMANEACEQFTMYRPPSQRDYAPDDDDRYPL